MTDILDLEGWTPTNKRIDGDEYVIEAEYTMSPKACTKCGNIGNLYKHGPKPIYIRDSPIRGRPVRILANASQRKPSNQDAQRSRAHLCIVRRGL